MADHKIPRKKKKKLSRRTQRILLSVLIGLLLAVFLFSAYKLYSIVHEYRVAQRSYSGLHDQVIEPHTPTVTYAPQEPGTTDPTAGLADPSPIQVDFDALRSVNQDVKGWLYSEGTVISYPVLQSLDNAYYLHRLYDRSDNPSGSLFMDFQCPADFSGRTSIIYGHHMNDGSMFASLVKYKDQSYYDEHPVMYLNTPSGNYRVDVFSGFITAADSTVYTKSFANDEEYQNYLIKMKAFSDFESDVTPGVDDRVLILSTCTYEYNEARYVVFGRLVPAR